MFILWVLMEVFGIYLNLLIFIFIIFAPILSIGIVCLDFSVNLAISTYV
jgi:hypothetical protein